jgi:hypothetical protein
MAKHCDCNRAIDYRYSCKDCEKGKLCCPCCTDKIAEEIGVPESLNLWTY